MSWEHFDRTMGSPWHTTWWEKEIWACFFLDFFVSWWGLETRIPWSRYHWAGSPFFFFFKKKIELSIFQDYCTFLLMLNIHCYVQIELQVQSLNVLKASKMKELVLKRQNELEEIYRGVHVDVNSDAARQILINLIESGSTNWTFF